MNSAYFKSLPADIRHDILMDMKELRKQSAWGKLKDLPAESQDFSTYQMSGLLKRRQVQTSLESAEKEMGGKVWSVSELEALLTEDGVIEDSKHAQRIANDENTRILYVRDIAKAISDAKMAEELAKNEPKPSTSKQIDNEDDLGDEYDLELQRAIQMSLGQDVDDTEQVISEPQPNEPIKLNAEQRKKFGSTVHGLVRGFMMEYADFNDDELQVIFFAYFKLSLIFLLNFQDMMEATQVPDEANKLNDSLQAKFPNTDPYVLYGTQKSAKETVSILSDDEEEVIAKEKSELVITVDANSYKKEEDIFADIFSSIPKRPQTPDVEIASISSSDDDTIEYEIPDDLLEKSKKVNEGINDSFVRISDTEEDIESSEDLKLSESTVPEKKQDVHELNEVKLNNKSINQESKHELNEQKSLNTQPIDVSVLESIDVEMIKSPLKSPKKITQQEICSENDKFWSTLDEKEEVDEICKDLSENEKFWFEATDDTPQNELLKVTNGEIKVTLSPQKSLVTKEEVGRAVDELKKVKTALELKHMKEELKQQQLDFEKERNKLNRQGMSITQQMVNDCKELLKLFGIPYIQSPMEAEAQCAFLNAIKITDGTISDDSDIWLFGAQTVYKNFFVQKKMVMEFRMENIEQMLRVDRKKLIQLAMLVGSDYTVGLSGVGAVTALEILAAFPQTPEVEGSTDQYQSMLSTLRKFREWFHNGKQDGKSVLKSKLKNIEIFEGFPSVNVLRAYLEPTIDDSTEPFTWGQIDNESLIELARTKLGWTRLKTEEILNPVIKRLNEKKQSTIKDYFKLQMKKTVFDNQKLSKRVQKAVGRMGGEEMEEEKVKKPRKRPAKKSTPKKEVSTLTLSESDGDEPPEKKSSPNSQKNVDDSKELAKNTRKRKVKSNDEPSTSTASNDEPPEKKASPTHKKESAKQTKVTKSKGKKNDEPSTSAAGYDDGLSLCKKKPEPRIPETKQVIPQRERDKLDAEAKKQKAIEIFKKSKK